MSTPNYCSLSHASQILGIGKVTLWRWRKNGLIPKSLFIDMPDGARAPVKVDKELLFKWLEEKKLYTRTYPRFISQREAANMAGVGAATLSNWTKCGHIPPDVVFRLGPSFRGIRYDLDKFKAWMRRTPLAQVAGAV